MSYFHLQPEILEYIWNKYSFWLILNVNEKLICTDISYFLFVNSSSMREWWTREVCASFPVELGWKLSWYTWLPDIPGEATHWVAWMEDLKSWRQETEVQYLTIASCCHQPPDSPHGVTRCSLALKRSLPTWLAPQVTECVIPVIIEGSWNRQGCKEEKGSSWQLFDWSMKDFTSTFWNKNISPEPSPAWERLAQACSINQVFPTKTWWEVATPTAPAVGETPLGCRSRHLLLPGELVPAPLPVKPG